MVHNPNLLNAILQHMSLFAAAIPAKKNSTPHSMATSYAGTDDGHTS